MIDLSKLDLQREKSALHLDLIKKFIQENELPSSFLSTAWQYYLPLSLNLLQWSQEKRTQDGKSFILGINGAQGTGKSTLAQLLKSLLCEFGLNVVTLSIDDFYLTKNERNQLASSTHPLLKTRGVPGTHDLPLANQILDSLAALPSDEKISSLKIPRFNKAIDDRFHNGDALPNQFVDIIILEGWCIGAKPQPLELLETPENELENSEDLPGDWRHYINQKLADEYQVLFSKLDYLAMLKAPNFEVIHLWRSQQEEQLLKQQSDTLAKSQIMNSTELKRFIMHYERLTRWMLKEMPQQSDITFHLNDNHSIVKQDTNNANWTHYIKSCQLMLVTDLDASLLDEQYSWTAANQSLAQLRALSFPVIFNSSKTLAEMIPLSEKIQQQFQSPPTAIVAENGGLIAYPNDAQYNISVSSVDIKAILKVAHELRRKNNYLFTGFSDMTPEEVSSATGLELKAASLAKQRNATEPLLWYDSQEKLIEFKKSLEDAGIRIVLGGQFIHLMGQADKADALQQLRAYYIKKHPSHHWLVVALGDSPNDQIMLNKADLGIQIPNKKRPPFNLSTTHSIQCTEYGPAGWQQGIREILQSFYGIQF
ncbi:HAD-IIB family hydrolase [Lentisphaera profundi]|uniref:HAD-IIB family hydrolase n=1 Tax=Lentisphaera profundi TaxID=1658616 RepID=A0ABY7W0V0_9BACT|nr:HAD-IIB family hydrolase [Lentisphaera profundi]WDE99179.1 HAD-IIB family hydrolase [Lentisphaera profundi]